MNNNTSSSGGIGFVGVLTIVFVILKLTGTIAWSWWWVLAPLWITFGIWFLVIIILGIIGGITASKHNH